MTKVVAVLGAILMMGAFGTAQAQVTLDLAKVTCDQYVGYKITDPRNIAVWLSGYHHGRQANTVVDTQGMMARAQELRDFCLMNPQVPVMQAAEKLLTSK
jgi:acid stress chaperone HdeB